VLNRHGTDAPAAEDTASAGEASTRTAAPTGVAAHRSDGPESRLRATTVAQQRKTPRPAADEGTRNQALPKRDVAKAPTPSDVPSGTVPAPPGTKPGDTRILSITDRRLDELQRTPQHVADGRKTPQQAAEKSSEDLGGWRPAASHRDPTETTAQLRETDR